MNNHDLDSLFIIDALPAPGPGGSASARINAQHAILAGHFPGRPVVPGVCLIDLARRVCSALLGAEHRIARARALKFLVPVEPSTAGDLVVTASVVPIEGGARAEAQITANGAIAVKVSADLVPSG